LEYLIWTMGDDVMEGNTNEIYTIVFKEQPDVLDVKQVSSLLGVSSKVVYRLLRSGTIESLKIGREFRIPKVYLMKYIKVFEPQLSQ